MSALAEVKSIVKSLVSSTASCSLTVQELNRDYRSTEGCPIPFATFGYNNLYDFLKSLDDCVKVVGSGMQARIVPCLQGKNQHIMDMNKSNKKKPQKHPQINSSYRHSGKPQISTTPSTRAGINNTNNLRGRNVGYVAHSPTQFNPLLHIPLQHPNIPYANVFVPVPSFPAMNHIINLQQQQQPHLYTTNGFKAITPLICPQLNITNAQSFANKPNFNVPILPPKSNVQRPQFTNTPSTPQPPPKGNVQRPQSTNTSSTPQSLPKRDELKPQSTNTSSTPQSLPKRDEPKPQSRNAPSTPQPQQSRKNHIPQNQQNKQMDGKNVRFQREVDQMNLKALHKALPEIQMRTYIPSIEEEDEKDKEVSNNIEAIPLSALDDHVDRVDFPRCIVRRGQKIPSCELPSYAEINQRFVIYISQVHSPYKFWFRFRQPDHILDELMNDIEYYYEGLEEDVFCMPVSCVMPGQICAALFKNRWHRAEILSFVNNGMVKVLYVDYGTVAEIFASGIKYLKESFLNIPSQALRGCLSHVKPIGCNWSIEATKFFLSITNDTEIHAQISDIDKENQVCYFILCNTDDKYDDIVNINKMMVYKGFALYDKEWLECKDNECKRYKHKRENYPTFTMLEKGEYPSLTEVIKMFFNGIDYETITDRYLFSPYSLNNDETMPEFITKLPFTLLTSNPFYMDILSYGQ